MTVNHFFNNTQPINEQRLIANLLEETIKIHGVDVYYFPRTLVNVDGLFTEDALSKFERRKCVEMYVKTVSGFEGQGDLISKFNLELRDEVVLVVSRNRFEAEIGQELGLSRPNEGDIIFFPPSEDYFEIKFVEHEAVFYQLGGLYAWELRCEKLEYSAERFETGTEHDAEMATYSFDVMEQVLATSNGEVLVTDSGEPILFSPSGLTTLDTLSQNQIIQDEAEINFDFTQPNPYLEKP